jgi:hypothetical protein
MRSSPSFKKRDVTRAAKAVLAAGVPIERIQIDKNGTINIVARDSNAIAECEEKSDEKNPWD